MMIPGELEHLESLVKVARKKKDAEVASNQVSMVSIVPTLRRLCINKMHKSSDVEVLPLTTVNLLQRSNSEIMIRDDADALKHAPGNLDAMVGLSSLYEYGTNERMDTQEPDLDSDTSEDYNEGTQLVGPIDGESEFGNTELEELVLLEGPQHILQLTLQKQAEDLMKEDITDADDYADWIRWAADAEQGKQALSGAANGAEVSVLL
ncbi:unnamed protein product [Sphagnum jensenii]|uniref:Uncharacterized protein n=1 Tax=Sphagnum jensenii TaxID=128206 RepID=A0ABP1AC86_9BRYO